MKMSLMLMVALLSLLVPFFLSSASAVNEHSGNCGDGNAIMEEGKWGKSVTHMQCDFEQGNTCLMDNYVESYDKAFADFECTKATSNACRSNASNAYHCWPKGLRIKGKQALISQCCCSKGNCLKSAMTKKTWGFSLCNNDTYTSGSGKAEFYYDVCPPYKGIIACTSEKDSETSVKLSCYNKDSAADCAEMLKNSAKEKNEPDMAYSDDYKQMCCRGNLCNEDAAELDKKHKKYQKEHSTTKKEEMTTSTQTETTTETIETTTTMITTTIATGPIWKDGEPTNPWNLNIQEEPEPITASEEPDPAPADYDYDAALQPPSPSASFLPTVSVCMVAVVSLLHVAFM